VPGRYRAVLAAARGSADAPCVGAEAALTIDFVATRRKAAPELVGAVEKVRKRKGEDRGDRRRRERKLPPSIFLSIFLSHLIRPSLFQFLHACCPAGGACASLLTGLPGGDVCEAPWAVCSR
jgi:hypothetical protein